MKEIVLKRDVEGYLIPTAVPVTLPVGSVVCIRQNLGGSLTVLMQGNLIRIADTYLDAFGLDSPNMRDFEVKELTSSSIQKILKTCYDPEIPVNIVDLGLVYKTELIKKESGYHVIVEMTLTAPGCGMGEVIAMEIKDKLAKIQQISTVHVELVFDPPWTKEMMTDYAKLELGLI